MGFLKLLSGLEFSCKVLNFRFNFKYSSASVGFGEASLGTSGL